MTLTANTIGGISSQLVWERRLNASTYPTPLPVTSPRTKRAILDVVREPQRGTFRVGDSAISLYCRPFLKPQIPENTPYPLFIVLASHGRCPNAPDAADESSSSQYVLAHRTHIEIDLHLQSLDGEALDCFISSSHLTGLNIAKEIIRCESAPRTFRCRVSIEELLAGGAGAYVCIPVEVTIQVDPEACATRGGLRVRNGRIIASVSDDRGTEVIAKASLFCDVTENGALQSDCVRVQLRSVEDSVLQDSLDDVLSAARAYEDHFGELENCQRSALVHGARCERVPFELSRVPSMGYSGVCHVSASAFVMFGGAYNGNGDVNGYVRSGWKVSIREKSDGRGFSGDVECFLSAKGSPPKPCAGSGLLNVGGALVVLGGWTGHQEASRQYIPQACALSSGGEWVDVECTGDVPASMPGQGLLQVGSRHAIMYMDYRDQSWLGGFWVLTIPESGSFSIHFARSPAFVPSRTGAALAAVEGSDGQSTVVLFGGRDSYTLDGALDWRKVHNDTFVFTFVHSSGTGLASLKTVARVEGNPCAPLPRFGAQSAALGNHSVVLYGGVVAHCARLSDTGGRCANVCSNDCFVFHIPSRSWREVVLFNPPPPLFGSLMACLSTSPHHDTLVLCGGVNMTDEASKDVFAFKLPSAALMKTIVLCLMRRLQTPESNNSSFELTNALLPTSAIIDNVLRYHAFCQVNSYRDREAVRIDEWHKRLEEFAILSCRASDLYCVRRLVEEKWLDPLAPLFTVRCSLVHIGCLLGHHQTALHLIDACECDGVQLPLIQASNGATVLHMASSAGALTLVDELLCRNAHPSFVDARSSDGVTALMLACTSVQVMSTLLWLNDLMGISGMVALTHWLNQPEASQSAWPSGVMPCSHVWQFFEQDGWVLGPLARVSGNSFHEAIGAALTTASICTASREYVRYGVVDSLLKHGAVVDAADSSGMTALSLCVLNSWSSVVNLLLQNGALPRGPKVPAPPSRPKTELVPYSRGSESRQLVLYASATSNPSVMGELVKYMDTTELDSTDVMFRNVLSGNAAALKELLRAGVSPNGTTGGADFDFGGATGLDELRGLYEKHRHLIGSPVYEAVYACRDDIVNVLVQYRANNTASVAGRPIWLAVVMSPQGLKQPKRAAQIVHCLSGHGSDVNAVCSPEGHTALLYTLQRPAARLQPFEDDSMLSGTPRLDSRDEVYTWQFEVLKALLMNGANPQAALKTSKQCALHIAAVSNLPINILSLLLEYGSALDLRDSEWRTPLMYSAEKGNADYVRMLLEKGARRNISDFRHNSALHLAAFGNGGTDVTREKIVRYLLYFDGQNISVNVVDIIRDDVEARNGDDLYPADLAEKVGRTKVALLLRKAVHRV